MTYLQDHTLNQKFSSGMCGHSTLQQAFQDFKIILKLAKKLRKPIFRNYRTFWPCFYIEDKKHSLSLNLNFHLESARLRKME